MQVFKYTAFSPEIADLSSGFVADIAPDIPELACIAEQNDYDLRILALITAEGRCVALSCCRLEKKIKLGGIVLNAYTNLGHEFYDYCTLFCEDGFQAALFDAIIEDASSANADCIFLKRLATSPPEGIRKGHIFPRFTTIYDASRDPEPFQSLLRKKSLKRHANKCKRELEYACSHSLGRSISETDLGDMEQLHIETRRYHDTESAFLSPDTRANYACNLDNRIFTRISCGGETIACHYGMIFGKTLIWHTPVVNIKFLHYSPLEVLLFETLKYCREHAIQVLDFGIGNEDYKSRFENDRRLVCDWIYPISARGYAGALLKRTQFDLNIRERSLPLYHMYSHFRRKLQPAGKRIFYCHLANEMREDSHNASVVRIDRFSDLVELFRTNNLVPDKSLYKKLQNNEHYYALVDQDNAVLASVWVTKESIVEVPGSRQSIKNQGKILIYGFQLYSLGPAAKAFQHLTSAVADNNREDRIMTSYARSDDPIFYPLLQSFGHEFAKFL